MSGRAPFGGGIGGSGGEAVVPETRVAIRSGLGTLLLGYSGQGVFTRAFKEWTGETPAAWRELAHALPRQRNEEVAA